MKRILVLSLCLFIITPTWSVWPVAVVTWSGIYYAAIFIGQQVGVEYITEYFQNTLQPQDLEQVQKSIDELKTQIAQSQQQAPTAEVQQVQNLLVNTEQLVKALTQQMHGQITDLDSTKQHLSKDVTLLQNELAQLRNQLSTLGVQLKQPFANVGANESLQVQVNYTYRPQNSTVQLPLTQDAILNSGDRYKITFTPNQNAWIYIFQIDSSGKIFQLFPLQEMGGVTVNQTNPVSAGELRSLPSATHSFYLDKQSGMETLYFIATKQQDLTLEAQYQAYQQAIKDANQIETAVAQANLEHVMLTSRGPGGIVDDPTDTVKQTVITDESGRTTLSATYLNGLCGRVGGCINMLQFQHR